MRFTSGIGLSLRNFSQAKIINLSKWRPMSLSQGESPCGSICEMLTARGDNQRVRLQIQPSNSEIHNQTFLLQIFHFSSTILVILFVLYVCVSLIVFSEGPSGRLTFPPPLQQSKLCDAYLKNSIPLIFNLYLI